MKLNSLLERLPRGRKDLRHIKAKLGAKGKVAIVLMLVVLIGGSVGGYYWYQETHLPDGAALEFSDRVVTVDELNQRMDVMRAIYGVQPPREASKMDEFRRDAAKSYVVSLALDKAAQAHGIVISDKTARDVLSRYLAEQFGEGIVARDKFVQALGNAGVNESAVLEEIKRQLALERLFDQLTRDIQVSQEDVRKAFSARKDLLGTPPRRHLRNIVVQEANDARRLLDHLHAGADFAKLAQRISLDNRTRGNGGDLGIVSRSQLEDGYAQAAFGVPNGAIFGPVQTKYGWNIGKVEDVLPPVPAEFRQVKNTLRQQLELERSIKRWREFLTNQIKHADVSYADPYRPKNSNAFPLRPSLSDRTVPTRPGGPR